MARYLCVVVQPVEPSELDLVTLQSEPAQPSIDTPYAYAMKTTWRGYVMWACAAVVAIILGIIPALWINRWRADAGTDPKPAAAQAEVTAEPITTPDPAPEPAPAPAVVAPTVPTEKPAVVERPRVETTKRKAERGKRPTRPAKRPIKTCDVYLHPHGCPR